MLRISEVAKRLGVSRKTVWNMIQRGAFPHARKVDPESKSVFLIPEEDLKDLLERQKQKSF